MSSSIKAALKRRFPRVVLHYKAYRSLIWNHESYLYATGWMRSLMEWKPMDVEGAPTPWMNYTVVKLLEERLTASLNVFEFGSGYSTLFLASRVRAVTSLEHDKCWFEIVKSQVPDNVELLFQEEDVDGKYCRTVLTTRGEYDVVVIDGRDRVNCMRHSISGLSRHGVILLDDSQRECYQEGVEFARSCGFRALGVEGLKATGTGVDRTTIFYRDNNCLGI